jgi:hypothetical protein
MLRHLALASLLLAQGAAWSATQPAGAAPLDKPVPGQGLFVAVGYGGFRGWSLDGQTWTAERWSDKNQDDPNIIFTLVYRAGVFYASGGGTGRGFILRSTDGRHWDEVVTSKWRISVVIDLGDRLLSAFDDHFQLSADGLTWKAAAEAKPVLTDEGPGWHSGYFRRWVAGDGAAVFAGDYALPGGKPRIGWIGGSRDGETPLAMTREAADVCGLDFGNHRFVACTKDGTVITSRDGLRFTQAASSGDQHDDGSVRFHDGVFYLRGRKGVQTSTDGERWTPLADPPRLPRAVSPDGIAVDCGWGGITVAPDGRSWRKATVPVDPTGVCAVVYGVPLANLPKDASARKKRP